MFNKYRVSASIVSLIGLLLIAASFAWYKSIVSFTFGDQALFHSFGKWINQDEVYIKDFIHFRTPGGYYHVALFQYFLGENFRATAFSLLVEGQVYQTFAAFILGLAATRAIFGRASFLTALLIATTFLAMTPIFQLRTAFPALALAAYLMTQCGYDYRRERLWALTCGVLLGISFWFGQEIFILLAWTIFCVEMINGGVPFRVRFTRLAFIATSALITILIVTAILLSKGLPVDRFIYYIFPYALILQPKGMDLPFPSFSLANIKFYALFFIVASMSGILLSTSLGRRPAAIALLCFATIRLVSALGRADYLHLVFSVSEIVVLVTVAIALLPTIRLDRSDLVIGGASFFIVGLLFVLAINIGASCLLMAPPILCSLARLSSPVEETRPTLPAWVRSAALLGLIANVGAFYPHSVGAFRYGLDAMHFKPDRDLIGGVFLPKPQHDELRDVEEFFVEYNARNIFSYPIRPEFYAFVPNHSTRLTYLEPQTTEKEVQDLIDDLRKNPADVIVQDVGQVREMRSSLFPVADYIASNYRTVRFSLLNNLLELRVPLDKPHAVKRLVDRVSEIFHENPSLVGLTVENTNSESRSRLVLETSSKVIYQINVPSDWVFKVSLDERSNYADLAIVELQRGNAFVRGELRKGEGERIFTLPEGDEPINITLTNMTDSRPVGWIDPIFQAP